MSPRGAMGSHQSHKMLSDVWLTPPFILDALGPFDLDPCACTDRPWDTAKCHFTKEDEGLYREWSGLVWMNPPYGLQAAKWLQKLAYHDNGIALLFARTETKMFSDFVWPFAKGIFFFDGRLFFHQPDGTRASANAGAPSCLIAYGREAEARIITSGLKGVYLPIPKDNS